MRLLQISDTHFGTERPEVIAALRQRARELAPDLALLIGDITQRARPGQFRRARRFFEELPARDRLAIPGNHDLPLFNVLARLLAPYHAYQRAFGSREHYWEQDGLGVLCLDATHPARHKDGHLPAAALRRKLEQARGSLGPSGLLILAVHQPLWTAWEEDRNQTLLCREETAALLAEFRVDVVLSGHVHVPLISTSTGIFPDLPWRFVLSGSGTAVSQRTRPGAPNSFNLLDLDPGRRDLRLRRYDYGEDGFRCVAERRYRRGERGWVAEV